MLPAGLQLVCRRAIPAIDVNSLMPFEAKEVLFRCESGYLLYLSRELPAEAPEERVVMLDARDALLWLNEQPSEQGSFWN
jgi:hypothetical protein